MAEIAYISPGNAGKNGIYEMYISSIEETVCMCKTIDKYIAVIKLMEKSGAKTEEMTQYIKYAFISLMLLSLCDIDYHDITYVYVIPADQKRVSISNENGEFEDIAYIDYDMFAEMLHDKRHLARVTKAGKCKRGAILQYNFPSLLDNLKKDRWIHTKSLCIRNIYPKHPLYDVLKHFGMFPEGQPQTFKNLFERLKQPDFDTKLAFKYLVAQMEAAKKIIKTAYHES